MSRTIHTTPTQYLVKDKDIVSGINIIERNTGKFDYHPLDKKLLIDFLNAIDPKYLFGLKEIELKQKRNSVLARRLGQYSRHEKRITLYSIEFSPIFTSLDNDWIKQIKRFRGEIKEIGNCVRAVWPDQTHWMLWYFSFVVCHEIAHHYINMNKFRRRPIGLAKLIEPQTDFYAERIYDSILSSRDRKL